MDHEVTIYVRLWPSEYDFKDTGPDDVYWVGLREYLDSAEELVAELQRNGVMASNEYDSETLRFAPELLVPLVLHGTVALAAVLHRILKVWMERQNGRRITVQLGEEEVDISGLGPKDLETVLKAMEDYQNRKDYRQTVREHENLQSALRTLPRVAPDEVGSLSSVYWKYRSKAEEELVPDEREACGEGGEEGVGS